MTPPVAAERVIRWRLRQRRVFFALTPLIDVMFLLLIFFMLSSQISPYSLLTVGAVARAGTDGGTAPADRNAAPPLALRVSHGMARIGGSDVAFADLHGVAKGFIDRGMASFVVVPSASANVQDVVTVLETLKAAAAKDVTLVAAGRRGP